MSSESEDLANPSQQTRSVLYRGHQQILTEEERKERTKQQHLEQKCRVRERNKQSCQPSSTLLSSSSSSTSANSQAKRKQQLAAAQKRKRQR
eukprot:14792696-Ditylum_brightwellii.AAC.1